AKTPWDYGGKMKLRHLMVVLLTTLPVRGFSGTQAQAAGDSRMHRSSFEDADSNSTSRVPTDTLPVIFTENPQALLAFAGEQIPVDVTELETAKRNDQGAPSDQPQSAPHRILGIIPNYRTSSSLKDYRPLTPCEKFKIARQDSFDRGAFIV